MNREQGDVRHMSDTVRMRLAAGLLLLVVSVLLLPIGVVLRDSLAGSPAANSFSIVPDTVSDSVSATPAQFRVGESGAATYAIPLFTVPGTAGVTPQLSLSYSSQGGDGPVGQPRLHRSYVGRGAQRRVDLEHRVVAGAFGVGERAVVGRRLGRDG